MAQFLDPLSDWPSQPPPGYRGQLEENFQRSRAAAYSSIELGDCTWYHTTELPDGTIVDGQWDLRERERDYLGRVPFRGQTVLEFGPASGHLTFYMESQGARVTGFEVGYDAAISIVPGVPEHDLATKEAGLMDHTRRTVNSWWYLHRTYGSAARLVHGNIYRPPDDLGQFDIVVLGSILLHCRDFALALQEACKRARTTIVVAEPLQPGLEEDERLVRFLPDMNNREASVTWWGFSPGAISALLWRFGFEATSLVRHVQRFRREGGDMVNVPYFTIVGNRLSVDGEVRVPGGAGKTHQAGGHLSERLAVWARKGYGKVRRF